MSRITLSFEDNSPRENGKTVIRNDFRSVQFNRFNAAMNVEKIVNIDLSTNATVEDLKRISSSTKILPLSLCDDVSEIVVYVTTWSFEYRLLFQTIKIALSKLYEQVKDSCVVVVEDLVYVERPYIFQNKEKNFLKNIQSHYAASNEFSVSISSSQELMNRWGEGDIHIVDVPLLQDNVEDLWNRLQREIEFHEMFNQGNKVPRLIAIQSIDSEEGRPLYRHPNDEEPPNVDMQPIVRELLRAVEQATGVVGLNHVLIQHYRDGRDNIAQHSDKTLDIDQNTPILNLSVGSARTMHIQHKRDKQRIEHIVLRHGQCVVFGLDSNRHWYHEVPKDVTMPSDPLFGTSRISFTFRRIATFVHKDGALIGQGSPFKTMQSYQERICDIETMCKEHTRADLIIAFSKENKQSDEFDWESTYGAGFLIK